MTEFDLEQIVQTILNQDAFYRILQRGNPPIAYRDISDEVRKSLSLHFSESAQQWPLSEERLRELLIERWREVLTEKRLKELALNAQKYSLGTPSFQKAIDVVYRAIMLSNRLNKKSPSISDEAYREAQNILQLSLCEGIKKFDHTRGSFMGWINYRFDKTHIPKAINDKGKGKGNKFKPVENYDFDRLSSSPHIDPDITLIQWLQEDYIFRIPTRDKPQVTFLDIALARTKNIGWEDIANQFDFKVHSTPSNFLNRWIGNLLNPVIDEHPKSSLYEMRLARYKGYSWQRISQYIQCDESMLRAQHIAKLKRFPSYRDVIRNDRYDINMPDEPEITFSKIAMFLLEEGCLWQEVSRTLNVSPNKLKTFYLSHLQILWPNTELISDTD